MIYLRKNFIQLTAILLIGGAMPTMARADKNGTKTAPQQTIAADTTTARGALCHMLNAHYASMEKMAVMLVKWMNTPGLDRKSDAYKNADKLFQETMKNLKTRDRALHLVNQIHPSADTIAPAPLMQQKKIMTR